MDTEEILKKITDLEDRVTKLEQTEPTVSHKIKRDTNRNFERENPEFDLFWKAYPHRLGRKVNKKSAKRAFCRQEKSDIPAIVQAVGNYSDSLSGLDEYSQNAWKWLLEENWKEYLD